MTLRPRSTKRNGFVFTSGQVATDPAYGPLNALALTIQEQALEVDTGPAVRVM